ncbi:MAG TPA: DUF2336 domain-containing protein [Alphaproteobacteria bacterium]|nr:DUF2336 domain-containing protein [Alphaproteobacteria bacterium]
MDESSPPMVNQDSARIRELVALARDSAPAARARLVAGIGDLIFDEADPASPREKDIATDILRYLVREAETAVRRALADRLAREPKAPRDLIVALAHDEITVARPVLLESTLLADADLIEVIHQRTLQHQLAITMRQQVSETVSAALVSTGNAEVMRSLVDNPKARIARRTYEILVDQSRSVEALQAPLVRRKDLDADLAARMYAWVSAALRKQIVLNFDVDPKLLDEALSDSLRNVTREHASAQAEGSVPSSMGDDPAVLLQLLRAGEIAMFEALLARKTGLRLQIARRAFYEPGGRPLATACKAIGVEKAHFAAIFLLARQARPGDKIVDPGELNAILSYYDGLAVDTAKRMLEAWRGGVFTPGPRTRA